MLVVDDATIRKTLSAYLEDNGHVIWTRETTKMVTDTNDNPSILLVCVEIDTPILEGNQCPKQ